jgi:dTDP-glucose 4,6-dehydratase
MKLLVTGGYGFIGSNFILKLLEEHTEYQIKNIDAELNGSNPKNLSEIENHKNYEFVKGDITDYELMKKLICECDTVINLQLNHL